MRDRLLLGALLLIGLVLPITSCNDSPSLTSIQVNPTTVSATAGATWQFTAIGSYTHPGHAAITKDITDQVTWASSSTQMVTVNSKGFATATGLSIGTTQVSASAPGFHGDIIGTANVTVTASTGGGNGGGDITSISVIPATETVSSLNETTQYIAIGKTSSGTSVDVTNFVSWTSSNASIASITQSGLATALAQGSTTITAIVTNADFTSASGSATLNVAPSTSPEPLASLSVTPTSQTALAINQTAQFIAIATTSGGTTVDLTNQGATINGATVNAAVWTSSNPAVAAIDPATGIATALSAGTTAITAVAKNPDGTVVTAGASFTVTVPTSTEPLVSMSITPSSQTALALGQTAQFLAIATTGTGTSVNLTNQTATINGVTVNAAVWHSSNPSVATISPTTGVATAVGVGTTAITAIGINPDGTVVTGTATFTVSPTTTPEPYVSLAIIPASQTASSANETAQFIAIGTTPAGTTFDLTSQCLWSSSDTAVATISPTTGLATAHSSGTAAITAVYTNGDGTVVTGVATFTVSIASVKEPLISLSLVPTAQTILAANQTAQFIAIGTTSAGTTVNLTNQSATVGTETINAAVFSSSNVAVGTINPATGLATALTSGVTTITAIATNPDGTVVTGTAALTVTIPTSPEPLVSLAILPGSQTASSVGETAQYIAIGTTSTGTTVNLTDLSATVGGQTIAPAVWKSSDPTVGTIDPATGVATAEATGTTAITAIATNPDGTVVTGTATFSPTISASQEQLLSLTIIPVSQTVNTANETNQFIAIGTFSASGALANPSICGSTGVTQDCTAHVTWSSSDVKIATISQTGLATALDTIGTTAITAVAQNPVDKTLVTGSAAFTQSLSGGGGVNQSTLTVTLMGSGAANGVVTSTALNCSATNPSGCTQSYPLGSALTLTAAPINGATFGGWSSNCTPINATQCTITLGDNSTVAAIFY